MIGLRRRLLGLCLPWALFFFLDMGLTLNGQPSEYWGGDYTHTFERSPTLSRLLRISPAAFVAGVTAIAGLTIAIILLLPDALALVTSIAGTVGNAFGASTWLSRHKYGYQGCILLCLLTGIVLGFGIWWGWRSRPMDEYRVALPAHWRWLLTAVLVAIGACLALWPG